MRIPKRPLVIGIGSLTLVSMLAATFVYVMGGAHAATPSSKQVISSGHSHHISGLVVPQASGDGGDHKPPVGGPAFENTPPLAWHPTSCFFAPCKNGDMLMTASTGPLVVVPIYWSPTGYPMSASYKNLITTYLGDVAKDSGGRQNVYSVANEYYGSNGQIQYNVALGPVLTDTNPINSDCTVGSNDTSGIYPDGSG